MRRPLAKMALMALTVLLLAPAAGAVRKLEPTLVNDARLSQTIGPNSKGSAVVRAQILLNRSHFSCGQIDGEYGGNVQKTVAAFRRNRNLSARGQWGRRPGKY